MTAMAQAVTSTTRDLDLKHLWHGNVQHRGLDARPPLEVARAEGCYVFDADGRRYLDAMAGLFCVNVGYGRREIVDAVTAQMSQLAYYPLTQSHGPAAHLAARVAGMLPRALRPAFGCVAARWHEGVFACAGFAGNNNPRSRRRNRLPLHLHRLT